MIRDVTDLGRDNQEMIQYCPDCRSLGFPWYRLCDPHAERVRCR